MKIISGSKREDPLKILDPSSKKLVTVESQRIMAVLDDTICKIRLVTLLPELTQNTDKSVFCHFYFFCSLGRPSFQKGE